MTYIHWILSVMFFRESTLCSGVQENTDTRKEGKDLFASLSQIKLMWHNEIQKAELPKHAVQKFENPPNTLAQ